MFAILSNSMGQDKFSINIGAGFSNKYIFRGVEYGNGSFQPDLTLSYKGAYLNAWSWIPFDKDNFKELDLTLGYNYKGFSISVLDVFSAYPSWMLEDNSFSNFKDNHQIEIGLGYERKYLALNWYTVVAGFDGTNKKGKRAYTSYIYVGVPLYFEKFNLSFQIGATPWGTTSYSCDHFAVTDINVKFSKDIFINRYFSIPIFAQIGINPHLRDPYGVLGVRFSCNPLK